MLSATKIRLYPNDAQAVLLAKSFGCARWFWNNSLAETQKVYQETGKGLGQFALNNRLPALKKQVEWLSEPYSQVLQAVSLNMSRAFINFFERRSKYPKFKSKHDKQSIHYTQNVKIFEGCKVYLPKIGHVKAVVHRNIVGKIKTVTVSKDCTGKYFASILSETEEPLPPVSYEGKWIGVDVGLTDVAVTSEGSKFANPRHMKKAKKNLVRKQRSLSRKVKGSNNRCKARTLVAKAHSRITNQRKDFLHKVSAKLVNENQVLAVEDLNVKGMMKNHKLAGAIADVGWGMFTSMLKYKAAKQGKGYIEVNRFFPSSKLCNVCLRKEANMPLNKRMWTCVGCGTVHDRDINAALNIRNEAKRMMAAGLVATACGGSVSPKRGRKLSVAATANETRSLAL
jgi:putative transposase